MYQKTSENNGGKMKRFELPNDMVAMAIIYIKGNIINEFITDFEECEHFQKTLYQKLKEIEITPYHYDEFNEEFLVVTNAGITLKENHSYIETLMRWLSRIPKDIANILLNEQIMLETLINYKKQKIESEINKIEILENKLSKPKIIKK